MTFSLQSVLRRLCVQLVGTASFIFYIITDLTCTELQQRSACFVNLHFQSGLTQVQPDHACLLRQGEGEQKPRSVPCPELKANAYPSCNRRCCGARQLEEAVWPREGGGDSERLGAGEGHVALGRTQRERKTDY